MTPVYQTILTPPHGNCLQACIASILELPLEEVPNFMRVSGPAWYDRFVNFLLSQGLFPIYLTPEVVNADGTRPYGYYLVQGKSPRGDFDHVVVYHNGKLAHDPNPAGGGIEGEKLFIVLASTNGGGA